jgi:hypothetical protein
MENFGILLSVPVALLMSMVYCRFLAKAVRRLERVRICRDRCRRDQPLWAKVVRRLERGHRLLYWASLILLGLFLGELVLLARLGVVQSRAVVGSGFHVAFGLLFFLGLRGHARGLGLRVERTGLRGHAQRRRRG